MWPFTTKPNDWVIVYTDRQKFTMIKTYDGRELPGTESEEACMFILKYSPSRNKYKVETQDGNYNYSHKHTCEAYQRVLNKQAELQAKQ